MASIRKEIDLGAPADQVWDALRDIGALHTRLVPGFVVDTQLEPGARVVTFANGHVFREFIVDVSEADRRVAWAIVDKPFQHYSASAQVLNSAPGRCRLVWMADLLPHELHDTVATQMDLGMEAMRVAFQGSSG